MQSANINSKIINEMNKKVIYKKRIIIKIFCLFNILKLIIIVVQ